MILFGKRLKNQSNEHSIPTKMKLWIQSVGKVFGKLIIILLYSVVFTDFLAVQVLFFVKYVVEVNTSKKSAPTMLNFLIVEK